MYPGSTIANGHQRYSHGQWDVREVTEGVPGKLIQKCLTSHSALGSLLRENTPFLPLTTHTHTLLQTKDMFCLSLGVKFSTLTMYRSHPRLLFSLTLARLY